MVHNDSEPKPIFSQNLLTTLTGNFFKNVHLEIVDRVLNTPRL